MDKQNIIIYKAKDSDITVKVNLEKESVWLTQKQMQELFEKNKPTISEHISNIFKEGELKEKRTVRNFRTVQKEGNRSITREVKHYNLDVIISVGYRVKSVKGTQFRIWATSVLRQHILEGYTINQERLAQNADNWDKLKIQMENLRNVLETKSLTEAQSKSLIRVITDYTKALELIDQVDKKEIPLSKVKETDLVPIKYDDFIIEVNTLREELKAGVLFGQDTRDGLQSALNSIQQSIGGNPIYASAELKAANLLYLIIKNHPFTDGNKRIGSFAFVRYLDVNNLLYKTDGSKRIEQDTLVAIALLIAQSSSKDKDLMIDLVVYLIEL